MSKRTSAALHICRIPFDGPDGALPTKADVGAKAFNLMMMARHGLPVPPGFVIGSALCRAYMADGRKALAGLETALIAELDHMGKRLGRCFGDGRRPLLVSVRSGAAASMPGMMETVLNVGLTREAATGLIRLTGNPRLAYDCRRRLLQQFAEVVLGKPAAPFDAIVDERLIGEGLTLPNELDCEALRDIAAASEEQYTAATGKAFPEDALAQLVATIEAVLRSWSSEKAQSYRRLNGLDDTAGTAVTIQAMVFGNAGPTSGSGVGFTRSPADGTNGMYLDYLANAQGEDVVAGRRNAEGSDDLQRRVPAAYADLVMYKAVLERAFSDMQDFEFTVEDGRLYMLQCRSGKRTPLAALRIAHDLVAEGLIAPPTAVERLSGLDLSAIETTELAPAAGQKPMAHAVPASAGVVCGAVVFDPARVAELKSRSMPVILFRDHAETSDIDAVSIADGLVTRLGARTSHAAVVARQLGKVCLVGCGALSIDASERGCRVGDIDLKEGDFVTIDGGSGALYAGEVPVRHGRPEDLLARIDEWRRSSPATSSHADGQKRRPRRAATDAK